MRTSVHGDRAIRAAFFAIAFGACGAFGGASLVACSSTGGDSADVSTNATSGALNVSFANAAQHASVPRDLLVAIAQVEDGLGVPAHRVVLEENIAVAAAGPLMLRHGKLDTLARGAQLASTTQLDLRQNADLALDAGALVLAELGTKTGARAEDLASWQSAIEEMSGYADDAHREDYAHRVFATLARGGQHEGRDGEKISIAAHALPPSLTLDISSQLHTLTVSQFPGAQWIPTSCVNKCDAGRGGESVQYIVIHDTEGGWDASVSTLQNDPGKSVQYIVGNDGKIAQFVTEETTAWHAGNYFFNQRSVGIEHVGYANKPYTEAQYAASAKLVDYLAKKYKVARDRAHIIGHEQIPNGSLISESAPPCSTSPSACEGNSDYGGASHHTDPGDWEWATYMPRIAGSAKCNDVTPLLNCSYDKTHAFRCKTGGKVEVTLCNGAGGCEAKPAGQDDVCNTATKPASTAPVATTPPAEGMPPVSQITGAPLPPDTTSDAPPAADSGGGCSVSRTRDPRGTTAALGLAFVALAAAFIRRRVARGARDTA